MYSYQQRWVRSILSILAIAIVMMFSSCRTQRELAYVSDAERDSAQQILSTYAHMVHPGDQLYIYVSSETMESVVPFNQETHKEMVEMSRRNIGGGTNGEQHMSNTIRKGTQKQVTGYLVDENGFITFPVLGRLNVSGIAYDSVETLIQHRLIAGEYVMDPVVTVSPMNFRVSVIGEVRRPRELHITGERLTIFEALAMCGDITIDGKRENVIVLREKNGAITPIEIDMTKKTIFDSEAYYLQQNDIVYVEPTERKKKRANYDPYAVQDAVSYGRLGVSLLRFAHKFYRRYVLDRRGLFN